MPIVDGSSATKAIREYELKQPAQVKWARGRIPVFAVSASLMERDRESYVASGFDGWIMKPIDFQRVHVLSLVLSRSSFTPYNLRTGSA